MALNNFFFINNFLFIIPFFTSVAVGQSSCPSSAFTTNTFNPTLYSPVLLTATVSTGSSSPAIAWKRSSDSAIFVPLVRVQSPGSSTYSLSSIVGLPNVASCGSGPRIGFFRAVRLSLNGAVDANGPAASVIRTDLTFHEDCSPGGYIQWCNDVNFGYGMGTACNGGTPLGYGSVDLFGTGLTTATTTSVCSGHRPVCGSNIANKPAPFLDSNGDGSCGLSYISHDVNHSSFLGYDDPRMLLRDTVYLSTPFTNAIGPTLSITTPSTVYSWTCAQGFVGGPFLLSNANSNGWFWVGDSSPLCTSSQTPSVTSSLSCPGCILLSGDSSSGFAGFSADVPAGLTFVPDRAGNLNSALSFSSGGFLSLNNLSLIPSSGARSVSLWVKTTDQTMFFSMGGCYSNLQWSLLSTGLDWNTISNRLKSVDGSQEKYLNDGFWHHFAVTQDALGNTRFYVDGTIRFSGMNSQTLQVQPYGTTAVPKDFLFLGRSCVGQTWTGVLDDVRMYSRALTATEVLTLSHPPLPTYTNAINPSLTAGATSYTWYCVSGYFGPTVTLTRSTDGTWTSSGGSVNCEPCATNTYSYGGSSCSSCPTDATIVTGNTRGCTPSTSRTAGPIDSLVFYLSGTSTEGVSAFPNAPSVSYTTSPFGDTNGALTLPSGSSLSITPSVGSALLSVLPAGNAAWSVSAWVKCPSGTSSQFLSWGRSSPSSPGSSACDSKWHHLALTHGEGSATNTKMYVDGTLVSTISETLTIPSDGSSTLIIGSVPISAPGTYSFTGSPGVSTCPSGVSSFVSSSLPCAPITGPVDTSFYFSCDEAEGTGAYSVTNPSGITYVADRFGMPGRALQLNDAYFSTPVAMPLSTGNAARSVSMFVKCITLAGDYTPLVCWGAASTNAASCLTMLDSNTMHWSFWGNDVYCPGCWTCDGLWHHWVSTFDGSTVTLYVDSVVKTSASKTTNTPPGTTLKIGREPDLGGIFNKNTGFDDIRIYNRALSPTEISSMFSGSLYELRLYSRALSSAEVLTLSQPPFSVIGSGSNAILTSTLSSDTSSYTFACMTNTRGNGGTLTRSSVDRSWAWSPRPFCDYCPPGTYLPSGASSCSLCPAGYLGNRAGLTSPTCSGACPIASDCPAGTAYPPSPSLSSLSCASGGARAVPTSLGMRL